MKQPGIVLCTRLNSRRLPNKPLQEINGIPIIVLLIERLLKGDIPVCVALPSSNENDAILDVLHDYDVEFYHGSDNNVLDRFYMAAKINNYDPIVRVTHDDILIDTGMMKDMVTYHQLNHADYTFVKQCIEGTGAEIVNLDTVEKAVNNYKKIEHLSYAFRKYADNIQEYVPPFYNSCSNPRLTIDYPEDLKVMQCVYDVIGYNDFDMNTLKVHLDSTLKNVVQWNKQPEVTIYTCAYNAEKTIERAIESVLDQEGVDFEYIIYDDGSTDKTKQILWRYAYHKNIKFMVKSYNMGLAASCNKVLEQAKGKYYIRLDTDDEFSGIDSVYKMYQKMEESPHAAICYSDYIEKDKSMNWNEEFSVSNTDHHMGCAMLQARAFQEIKFNDNLRHYDGYDFYTRAKDKFDIIYLKEPTWIYHQTAGSMSKSEPEEREKILQDIDGGKYKDSFAEKST